MIYDVFNFKRQRNQVNEMISFSLYRSKQLKIYTYLKYYYWKYWDFFLKHLYKLYLNAFVMYSSSTYKLKNDTRNFIKQSKRYRTLVEFWEAFCLLNAKIFKFVLHAFRLVLIFCILLSKIRLERKHVNIRKLWVVVYELELIIINQLNY